MIKKVLKSTSIAFSIFAMSNISLQANKDIKSIKTDGINYNKSLNATVNDLADKLFQSSRVDPSDFGDIAITSFVDLHRFNKTNHLGRSLSEGFFNELFSRGFDISDFRGQSTIAVNANGEYFLTRDINKLKKSIKNRYVLVGTFTNVDKGIMVSVRIMDNTSGHIVAAARTYYRSNNCQDMGTCPKKRIIKIRGKNYIAKNEHNAYIPPRVANTQATANISLINGKKNSVEQDVVFKKNQHPFSLID